MKNFSTPLRRELRYALLVFCLVLTASGFKCGGPPVVPESTIRKAVVASSNLAHYTGDVVKIVAALYHDQKISLVMKDKLAATLVQVSTAGERFDNLLGALHGRYGEELPPASLDQLSAAFDEVVRPYLETLAALDSLPPLASSAIRTALRALSGAVALIAGTFSAARVTGARERERTLLDAITRAEINGPGAAVTLE